MQNTGIKASHGKKSNAWKYILCIVLILLYILPIYVLVILAFLRTWRATIIPAIDSIAVAAMAMPYRPASAYAA